MRNSLLFNTLLLMGTVLITGCTSDETARPDTQPPENSAWTVSVEATGSSVSDMDDNMRAVFYGGNNGHRFSFIWDDDDVVEVYKGNTLLGTLVPSVKGQETTTLTGTLTGAIAVNDVLTLYLPDRAYDYSNQDGTLGNLSLKHAFQQSNTTVTEAKAAGGTLSLTTTKLIHAQAYWWLRLTDQDGVRIHPTKIEITSTGGKIVKTKAVDGTTTYFTDVDPMTLVISKSDDNGEYPGEAFLAIRNELGAADTYKFKAWVGEDVYVGPYDRALTYAVADGRMDNVMRQVRKTTSATSLSIDAIPDKTFTGYAITPTLTVKDGENTLTLDTDYSVAYTANVNVGTATATITGLAESGDVCTTPYLGTQEATFNIVKATPVIVLDLSVMTLIDGHASQTRPVTRVFVDNNGNGTWDEGTDYDITSQVTVTYASSNETVATVIATTGEVTPVSHGTATITATVASAGNWNSQTATYTVNVEEEVHTGNSVDPWSPEDPEGGKIFVE